jgi:hypothetical protein
VKRCQGGNAGDVPETYSEYEHDHATWRAVIDVLREKTLPCMREHADYLEQQLERHGPDEPTVHLSLTDDVFLRSYNWARWQLGIPLPVE